MVEGVEIEEELDGTVSPVARVRRPVETGVVGGQKGALPPRVRRRRRAPPAATSDRSPPGVNRAVRTSRKAPPLAYAEGVLRTRGVVRSLTPADRDAALDLCAADLGANVFVAARILEGGLAQVLGHYEEGRLTSLAWTGANIVPVETTDASRAAFAERLRRHRTRTASLLGPREQVIDLWTRLEPSWGFPRAIRSHQPLLATSTRPSLLGLSLDDRVRRARRDEVDVVLPAAEHMFVHEIGYRPYSGSARGYRAGLLQLIERGHTWVVRERGEVIFKTDVGSAALGTVQLQGVWLAPHLRGRGLSVPMLGSVVEQLLQQDVTEVTLYVNDFNEAALAAYRRLAFREVGAFATVLL